jgi:hypothetical protein
MFAKKALLTLSAGTLLAAALPAFADHDGWRHRHRAEQRVVVERPVYRGPVYVPQRVYAPRPAYGYGRPVYSEPLYAPAPVYAERDNTVTTIGGAAIGAFIGSQVGYGHNPAAIAAGAVIGGIIGSNF